MIDIMGVISSSPFPATRRLAENMMRCVFERAGSHLISKSNNRSVSFLARHYSNIFFTVIDFTERACGKKSAFERLELGEINRIEFIPRFRAEMEFMLQALSKNNLEELEAMSITYPNRVTALKKRFPLLADPVIQFLVMELCDVEAFLCCMEKVSLRKNVLNLLHYLRLQSQQEIRIFAVGNTWETEGQYRRMVQALSWNVNDGVATAFPISCPIEYAAGYSNYFQVNSLFDGYVQSYIQHKRKPYPDLFMQAIDEVMASRVPTGEALRYDMKPSIFYFDDVEDHCELARDLPGNPFTEVYLIEDGATGVYNDILRALKQVAVKDRFWEQVVKNVEKDIAPLFKPPTNIDGQQVSWIEEEINNYQKNLLFMPPPPNEWCVPVNVLERDNYQMDDDDQDAILFYLAQHLPHLFPLKLPQTFTKGLRLATQPGLATSAGPIVFENITRDASRYFESYRITLRTGSYTLRIQPRGPTPYGSADIRREFETMDHIHRKAPKACVPKMLIYCDSYAICGRRFFLRRYVDGELILNIAQLVQPRIRRPYSQRRVLVNVELKPTLFFLAAIDALVALHNCSLPRFMRKEEEKRRRSPNKLHPLLLRAAEHYEIYERIVSETKKEQQVHNINMKSTTVEELTKAIRACFDRTQLTTQMVPFPDRLVISHGNFDIRCPMFTHRSLEGRSKYPPQLLSTTNFRFTRLDDPLLDVANLALFNFLSAPEGIFGAPRNVQVLFPSPAEIVDSYCNKRGYFRQYDRYRRDDIFSVYLASLCLQKSVLTLAEVAGMLRSQRPDVHAAANRGIGLADQIAHRGIDLLLRRKEARL